MIKSFSITSIYQPYHLADIRTDGTNISWISDKTDQHKISRRFKNDFKFLKKITDKVSTLDLVQVEQEVAVSRYILPNGDLAEVTADGKTYIVNGTIQSKEEALALQQLIETNHIPVAQLTFLNSPAPDSVQIVSPTIEGQSNEPLKKKS